MNITDLNGMWQSKYRYESSGQGGRQSSEHRMVLKSEGNKVIIKTESTSPEDEVVTLELVADGNVLTGTFHERTSLTGHYKGAVVHGAIQLLVSKDGQRLTGKWAGFNAARTTIKTGDWELQKVN